MDVFMIPMLIIFAYIVVLRVVGYFIA